MPKGDRTGPRGQGPGTGRGRGRQQPQGDLSFKNQRFGAGPGGNCLCPNCKTKVPHKAGVPCSEYKCPDCGTPMVRG